MFSNNRYCLYIYDDKYLIVKFFYRTKETINQHIEIPDTYIYHTQNILSIALELKAFLMKAKDAFIHSKK